MNIEITKEDIVSIGHTGYNENGCAAIICSHEKSNIEYILLRNILKCFGEQYKVVSKYERFEDIEDLRTIQDVVYITNLPFETYLSAAMDRDLTALPEYLGGVEITSKRT